MSNDILVRIGADITQFSRAMAESNRALSDFSAANQQTFDAFKKTGAAVTGFGVAVAVGLGGAVKIAATFEAGMSKVAAISGATGKDLDLLTAKAREMGSATSFSATDSANALEFMALAGWSTEQMLGGITPILHLAEAGALELGRTSDLVTDSMAGLGLQVGDLDGYLDKVAKTAASSNTDIDALMEAFVIAGGTFSRFNVPLEESNAILGILANRGFKGSEAGTALNAIMTRMTATAGPSAGALKALGVNAFNADGSFRGMEVVLKETNKALSGLTDQEKAHYQTQIAGLNHGKAFSAMMGGLSGEYDELKEAIIDSDGALLQMRNTMKDNLQGAMENLSSAFEEIGISIGTALLPAVKILVEFIQDLADKFNGLSEGTKTAIAVFLAVAAAVALVVGPILLLIGFIPQIIAGFTAVSTVGASLGAAFTALTGPIGLAVLAIGTIVAALVLAYKKVEWFRDGVNEIWAAVKNATTTAFNGIRDLLKTVMDAIVKLSKEALDKLKQYWTENGEGIMNKAKEVFTQIKDIVIMIVTGTVDLVKKQLDKLDAFWTENGEAIMTIVKGAFTVIQTVIQGAMKVIQIVFQTVWPIITSVVVVAWNLIKTVVDSGITLVLGVIQTALKLLQGDWKGAWNTILDTMKTIWGNILSFLGAVDLVSVGKDIMNGLIKGISSMATAVSDTIKNIGNNIKTTFTNLMQMKSPSRLFMEYGNNIGDGLAIGINETKASNIQAIAGVGKAISAVTRTNAAEVTLIASKAEKDRTAIQKDFAAKRAELSRKSAQSSQSALKTHKNKKGEIVTTGENNVYKIRQDASAKLTKLNADEQAKLAKVNDKAWADIVKKENEVSKARLEAVKTYVGDKKSLEELSLVAESEVWRKSIDTFKVGTKERVTAQQEYQKALKVINDEITKTNEEYAGKMTAINEKLRNDEQELTDKYTKTVDDRANALYNFAGTFDYFEYKLEQTGADLLNNLNSQVSAFKGWQHQIDILSAKAIDDGLIAELRAMGPKALPQLVALNSMTDKQMTEYSKLYAEKSKLARTQAEKELIGMKADTAKQIKELQAVANRELSALERDWTNQIKGITRATDGELSSLKTIGRQAAEGLKVGLESMQPALVRTATDIANSVKKAMAGAFDIKSPSRWMRDFIGVNMMQGWMDGMSSMRSKVVGVSDKASGWMTPNTPQIAGYQTPRSGTGLLKSVSSESTNANSSGGFSPTITNNFTPAHSTPSESARKQQQVLRKIAMDWGV
ncbi:phage tail tape measure protein [Sporosarcina sp. E16_3]|uniref:phage tail tape measure protein n=1 Tax=Sporosarcina sp. E16_3 TaxID=2789293 RepID=UPI001A915817|nr:phage tail tape measure protein [Sporosarcina sp. E16_3]MBO0602696.1 phage tail tape measure protein [Sporosarcina sp. E16_3]